MKQNRVEAEDIFLWKGKNDVFRPRFSTRETWHHTRTVSPAVAWHKSVWFAGGTPKFSFCVWLAAHNRLSTGDRLLLWNRGLSTGCALCSHTLESRNHLFFSCAYASDTWQALAKNLYGAKYTTNWNDLIAATSAHWPDRTAGFIARYVFQATVHTIWRERNNRKHGDRPNPPATLIRWIDKQVRDKLSSLKASGDRRHEKGLQIWFAARS